MLHLLKIFLLALIQGATEFFPVSSSGHLVVFQKLLKFDSLPLVYDIVLHLGTTLSVCLYFFPDIRKLAGRFYERENLREIGLLLAASVPTALIGFLGRDLFEKLFQKPAVVGWGWLVTALVLLISRFVRIPFKSALAVALIIGAFQGLAIAPGISRSGMTIAVALMLGMGGAAAFRFSFLLSIPAVLGATLVEARHIPLQGAEWPYLAIALVLAALFGLIALFLLKKVILRDKFHCFAYYCLAAGILAILFF